MIGKTNLFMKINTDFMLIVAQSYTIRAGEFFPWARTNSERPFIDLA
jgi:hypothetical protein